MDMLSSTDIVLLKSLACGATAYFSQSYLQQYRQKAAEPLILHRKGVQAIAAKQTTFSPTRNVLKALGGGRKQCMVFYGSQTGTAERLAYQFSKEAKTRLGLECLVADLDDYNYDDLLSLPADKPIVFLLATYGEGEATDNAVAFNRYLQTLVQSTSRAESALCYAGFGLGNSSYQFYNEMIKRLDSALKAHGAQRIGTIGFGDDGKGTLEEDFLTWKDVTLLQLACRFGLRERAFKFEPSFPVTTKNPRATTDTFLGEPNKRHLRDKARGPYTLTNPYAAPLLTARDLCPNSPRQFLHIELDLSGSTLSYEAGDHLAVRPVNSNLEVDRFLQVLGLSAARAEEIEVASVDAALKVPVPTPTTYDSLARHYLDICAPVSRRFLTIIAAVAPTEAAKTRLLDLSTSVETFQREILDRRLNFAQVLEICEGSVTWANVPFSALLENIPVMKPRYYSISSCPLTFRKTVSITTVVEYEKLAQGKEAFKGVTTNYLLALSSSLRGNGQVDRSTAIAAVTHQLESPRKRYSSPTALISIRRSNFKLPRDPSLPIIMIGPGTGVAPFRGFVQSRARRCGEGKSVGRMVLFYGCRRSDEDFLYEDEWRAMTNTLTTKVFSIYTAFSREKAKPKKYVQHLFQDHAEELRRLILNEGACVYVCGDAHRMARDVFRTMAKVIAADSRFDGDSEKAEDHLASLKSSGRWLEDVW